MPLLRVNLLSAARPALGLLALLALSGPAHGQAELAPWGNLDGLRVQGQLFEINASLRLLRPGGAGEAATRHEAQRPHYARQGAQQVVTTRLDSVELRETVTDLGPGRTTVAVQATALAATPLLGTFLVLALPAAQYGPAQVQFLDARGRVLARQALGGAAGESPVASRLRIGAASRQLDIVLAEPGRVLLRQGAAGQPLLVYLPVRTGSLVKGQAAQQTFTIAATGSLDRAPVRLALDATRPGRPFVGFGGNFRLQNPAGDPPVIDYCLQHLRVAYGRVELPWRLWQPALGQDPTAAASQGQLALHVRESLELAQRLSRLGMPVIVTAWNAPQWAVVGDQGTGTRPGADGRWGAPLNPDNLVASYRSIADYLVYLKEQYGVEASLFSFNESDLGINVRQTGPEHAALIKALGAVFAARGLKTKLLLGDTADATGYPFIGPALADAAARPYIGAVSFHSWRGCDPPTLRHWADAAAQLGLPLLVGEGSIDAQAWSYPAVFEEPAYARQEISLYLRLLAVCQPASILQWQLTADYSPLAGGGLFGNSAPLHPTQRFWNLQQLAATPPGVAYLPLTANQPDIACAALGTPATGVYAVHIVNNGATRPATLTGLPASVNALRCYRTDPTHAHQLMAPVPVAGGQARFTLPAGSYLTLVSD